MNKHLEALQEKINKMQEELNEMKQAQEEEAAKQDNVYLPMLPKQGNYFLDKNDFLVMMVPNSLSSEKDQNVFPSHADAVAYADAFRVMLELRRCEGAGHYYDDGYGACGWSISECTETGLNWYNKEFTEVFAFCPPFPTEELAQVAIDKVGERAYPVCYALLS